MVEWFGLRVRQVVDICMGWIKGAWVCRENTHEHTHKQGSYSTDVLSELG